MGRRTGQSVNASTGQCQDFECLTSVERLTAWNVKFPPGFLARLKNLWWLDIRGGSAKSLTVAEGVKNLQYLAVNQVRGLEDLSAVLDMKGLRRIDLYGLPQVKRLPTFEGLTKLEYASIGQMKGLISLEGMLNAPALQQLFFVRKVGVNQMDIQKIIDHPTIQQFSWFAEDVPNKVWVPVVEKIGLPPVPVDYPEDWFSIART